MNESTPGNLPEAILGKFGSGSVNSGRPRRALRPADPLQALRSTTEFRATAGTREQRGVSTEHARRPPSGAGGSRAGENAQPPRHPGPGCLGTRLRVLYARLRDASIAPSSQMLCLRVSGITNRAMRNMTAGTAMGYASAQPRLPVFR